MADMPTRKTCQLKDLLNAATAVGGGGGVGGAHSKPVNLGL